MESPPALAGTPVIGSSEANSGSAIKKQPARPTHAHSKWQLVVVLLL
eukprot:CAMPEP_0206433516 /NCGR_PEP_ID=MMETSP0324_2-20121206/8576_1 /ASSEMBLY_ACC=CAM_ASM_000836 /TAXON_ID=2866 /ORGANISM="Crypthecodinium cohnii, Strain Seligo" /LENGTH=46 /DNA_ID= /DNA_START= /DNA_END= /DNA_ORIENTATION=